MNNYDWLLSRLDAFIRKYYANQLLRGALLLFICVLFYILLVSVGEYFLYMPVWLRVSLVSLFVVTGLFALVALVILPLTRMARLGKIISHEQAAAIVGSHFPEISDKLLNILQLKKQSDNASSRELIEASINQKASQLAVVPITKAVDLSKNKKLLPFLLPLVLVGVFILVAAPNVFKEASERLLQPTKSFEKPAPFKFVVQSEPLIAIRNTDFVLKVEVTGNTLPMQMSIELNGELIPMQALDHHQFQYTFRNVTEQANFRLYAGGFYSQPHTLKVVQKPILKSFRVFVDYPEYTGRKDEERNSLGDMSVPAGTTVSWSFTAEHTDEASLRFVNGNPFAIEKDGNAFKYKYRFLNDTAYSLILRNRESSFADSYQYHIQVIQDQFPVIQVQEVRDTVTAKQIFLNGTAGDDYGVARVLFHYDIMNQKNEPVSSRNVPLKATQGALTTFEYYFDVETMNLQPGQKLSYYIEAWDNDGVHGSKSSRSEVMSYFNYNKEQLDSAINANSQQINSGLSNSSKQTKEMQSDFKELQTKMLQGDKDMDWQQQQSLQEMIDQQMKLQNQVENVKKRFEEQKQQSNQKEYSEDVKEKQNELEKQLDNLLNSELKEQMKKLQELMARLNKENAVKTMEEMQQENKLFDMDLKRMQELVKQLEMQMRLEDLAAKMGDLAKKQLELKDQTDKGKKSSEDLAKTQEVLKKELDKAMNEGLKEAKDQNEKLPKPQDMQKSEDAGKKAQENMKQSSESLQQKQSSKSSQSQSKAAENLQQMADMLMAQSGGMDMEQLEMDIKAVRQILTNLMRLSFNQESLMKEVQATSVTSQTYITKQQEQKGLHGNSLMIRDSLFSLSKHLFKLAATVNKETSELEKNMRGVTASLENRRVGEAATKQQYVMTHANNLALMLNEILSNLIQKQGEAQKPGNGSCNKPGGKKPSAKPGQGSAGGMQLKDVITQQEKLGDAMEQMKNGQKPGDKPGDSKQPGKEGDKPGDKRGDKPGNKPGGDKPGGQGQGQGSGGENGDYGNSEQLAKFAQQQAAIRRQLQELQSLLNSKGMGNAKELREIQEKMDKNETDLVNRRFNNETLLRHKEILSRLIETEKALREQEQDDKRSSKEIGEISRPIPPELKKYMTDQQKLLELYRTVPPQLKPYYKNMVEQYYQIIGK